MVIVEGGQGMVMRGYMRVRVRVRVRVGAEADRRQVRVRVRVRVGAEADRRQVVAEGRRKHEKTMVVYSFILLVYIYVCVCVYAIFDQYRSKWGQVIDRGEREG